ncbi:MAG TPA: tetratricopeptide repeat protein [Oligoflexia bacterium]|nr:tetratricopeptide repeat protein [Oligoflexia bacterium]HMP26512.1 tetratricopeptide repeat protein [Oligoflexia bacterium]
MKKLSTKIKLPPQAIAKVSIAVCLLLTACHSKGINQTDQTLLANKKDSEAMWAFLSGQLFYEQEKSVKAAKSLIKAKKLLEDREQLDEINPTLVDIQLKRGKTKAALDALEESLSRSANDLTLLEQKVGLLIALNRHEEALKISEAILAQNRKDLNAAVLKMALRLFLNKNNQTAITIDEFDSEIRQEPLMLYIAGLSKELSGDIEGGLADYQLAAKGDPGDPLYQTQLLRVAVKKMDQTMLRGASLKLAMLGLSNTEYQQILQEIILASAKPIITNQKFLSDIRLRIALKQLSLGEPIKAKQHLMFLLASDPNHNEGRYYLASILAGIGRKQDALWELSKINSNDPLAAKAALFAAFLLHQNNKIKQAETWLRKSLKQYPDNNETIFALAENLEAQGKYTEAAKMLENISKPIKNNPNYLFHYAALLYKTPEKDRAIAIMEDLIKKDPNNTNAANFIAYHLAVENRDLNRAYELINHAITIDGNNGYFIDTLGWIYYQRGELEKAVQQLRRAALMTDYNPTISYHLVISLKALKKESEAKEIARIALSRPVDKEVLSPTEDIESRNYLKSFVEQ